MMLPFGLTVQACVGMLFLVLSNIIFYGVNVHLRRKGYGVSSFFNRFSGDNEFTVISKAIKEEKNVTAKKKLKFIRNLLYAAAVLFVFGTWIT